jgi:hypothetical protein
MALLPSSGEIHYLWWYIQGSIMNPYVRLRLLKAWGFCERHAWIAMLVESSLRHCFLMGPAIVYKDIMSLAVKVVHSRWPMKNLQIMARLRERGVCLMCDMDLGPETKGFASEDLIVRGRDVKEICRFAEMTRSYWEKMVCGRCLGNDAWPRCRVHLIEDALKGRMADISRHRAMLCDLKKHITAYSSCFRWELRGTATVEDAASMISAVGWCSGWSPFLSLVGMKKEKG